MIDAQILQQGPDHGIEHLRGAALGYFGAGEKDGGDGQKASMEGAAPRGRSAGQGHSSSRVRGKRPRTAR